MWGYFIIFIVSVAAFSLYRRNNRGVQLVIPQNVDQPENVSEPVTVIATEPDIESVVNRTKSTDIGTTERIIVVFQGARYDITDFAKKHPGGAKILIKNNGSDIEQAMKDNDHSQDAYNKLKKYLIAD